MVVPDPPMEERFILDPIRWSLRETKNDGSTGSGRERHGLFRDGAFQAARIRRPSIQYSRVVLPPGPNSWPLNNPAAWSVPARTAGFCWPTRIVQECGALATYRPLSRVLTSTICRCITGCSLDPIEVVPGFNPPHQWVEMRDGKDLIRRRSAPRVSMTSSKSIGCWPSEETFTMRAGLPSITRGSRTLVSRNPAR
jgi:hypothetical protein